MNVYVFSNMHMLQKNGTKWAAVIAKGVKKKGKFAMKQLQYPDVSQFVVHQAANSALKKINPEVAAPLMGVRAVQEALVVSQRTTKLHGSLKEN